MRTIGKGAIAAAMAVALLVAGAIAFVRSPGTPRVPVRTATSALLVPAVAAGSLDGTIASLQDRLKALPRHQGSPFGPHPRPRCWYPRGRWTARSPRCKTV